MVKSEFSKSQHMFYKKVPAPPPTRNDIFLFGEKFLIAITPLQQQLKSRFRGNLDEDRPAPLSAPNCTNCNVIIIFVYKNIPT